MVRQRIAFSVSLSSSAPGNTGGRNAASWALSSSMVYSKFILCISSCVVVISYLVSIVV